MEQIVAFFFVPVIALWLYHKLMGWPLDRSVGTLAGYGLWVAAVFAVTRGVRAVIWKFYGLVIDLDTVTYLALTTALAVVLAWIAYLARTHVEVKVVAGREEEKED